MATGKRRVRGTQQQDDEHDGGQGPDSGRPRQLSGMKRKGGEGHLQAQRRKSDQEPLVVR